MPANLVWHLATAGGAQAIGMENLGCVKPGWKADFMLVKPTLPTPLSEHNLYEQLLLYCNASHVDTVIAAGQIKKANGVVLDADIELLRARSQQAATRLWKKAA
jgi:5-methylthioadenosine/S-adenosylhomocysteine deaminase